MPPSATASSPPAPAAASAPASQPAPAIGWRQALAAWLAQHKVYPEAARQGGIEGSVIVRFEVDPTGRVIVATVVRGSGSPILDSAAEAMLRNAVMPPPSPATQEPITISVQIHYRLTD